MKKTVILPCGIKAEYTFMTNATVDLLTTVGGEAAINQILEKCVLSLGSITNISSSHIEQLHYGDKRFLLFHIRQLTYDDNRMEFTVRHKEKEYSFVEENLNNCLKVRSLLTKNGEEFTVKELSELPKQYDAVMKNYPIEGENLTVVMQYLTTSNLDSVSQKVSDILRLRNPSTYATLAGTDKTVLRALDISVFPAGKSTVLFKAIKQHEIEVTTVLKYTIDGESFEKDLLQMPEFFFQGIM